MANILIIEDDSPVRKIIRMMLEAEGHEVIEATDGDMGVQIYRNQQTDVVITDIVMPNKEGLETIKELIKDFPDVKIIAISGGGKVSGRHYLELAKQLGAKYTFEKPFNWRQLIGTVNEILSEGEN